MRPFTKKRRPAPAKNPVLMNILVDTVIADGNPHGSKVLMKFSTGHGFVDIPVMETEDATAAEIFAIEVRRALGIG